MPGSQTPRGPPTARENAATSIAFRVSDHVDTPNNLISWLNSPPTRTPKPTLRCALTGRQRMDGAIVTSLDGKGRYCEDGRVVVFERRPGTRRRQ